MWLVGNTIQRCLSFLVRERVNTMQMCADTFNKQCTNVEIWLVGWALSAAGEWDLASIKSPGSHLEPTFCNTPLHSDPGMCFYKLQWSNPKEIINTLFCQDNSPPFFFSSNQYARGWNKSVVPWINCVEAHSHGGIDYKGPLGCWSWKNICVITLTIEQQRAHPKISRCKITSLLRGYLKINTPD